MNISLQQKATLEKIMCNTECNIKPNNITNISLQQKATLEKTRSKARIIESDDDSDFAASSTKDSMQEEYEGSLDTRDGATTKPKLGR